MLYFLAIHTLAHILNFQKLVYANDTQFKLIQSTDSGSDDDKLKSLLYYLTNLPITEKVDWFYLFSSNNTRYVNPVRTANSNPILESLKILPGPTGVIMCLLLAIMASSSSRLIRRSFYNLFWYLHQICATIFMLGFILHGLQGLVTIQTNLEKHDPQQCYKKYSQASNFI